MTLMNPFGKILCPFCFQKSYPGYCVVYSSVNTGTVLDAAPQNGWERLRARFRVKSLDGEHYTKEDARRQCPSCHELLPANIERAQNYIIALVGGAAAGKTHYIGVVISQLKNGHVQQNMGVYQLIELSQEIEAQYLKEYHDTLIAGSSVLPQNQRASAGTLPKPLIYKIEVPDTRKPINLIIYDASGEDIAETHTMLQYAQYILHASAIIFLADPLTVPEIVNRVPPNLRPLAAQKWTSTQVLKWVMDTYGNYKRERRISIPIAITLSKADLFQYVRNPNGQMYKFLNNPLTLGKINPRDLQEVSKEVKEILNLYDPGLLLMCRKFKNVDFFAVSATGYPPDNTGRFPAIAPIRVLDPLLWTFRKLNVLKAR